MQHKRAQNTNGRTRYSGLESTFRILQGIHITNACTMYPKPLWIYIFYRYWININQKVWKMCIVKVQKPVYLKKDIHISLTSFHISFWRLCCCVTSNIKKTWRKCQKIKFFSSDFPLKRFNWDSTKFLGPLCHIHNSTRVKAKIFGTSNDM